MLSLYNKKNASAVTTYNNSVNRPKDLNLNICDLYRNLNEKKERRKWVFNTVLTRCHQKIFNASKNEFMSCMYAVPDFIIGAPLYNVKDCTAHIITSLRKNGFHVKFVYPQSLYISWCPEEIKQAKNTESVTQRTHRIGSNSNSVPVSVARDPGSTPQLQNNDNISINAMQYMNEMRKPDISLDELVKTRNIHIDTSHSDIFRNVQNFDRSGADIDLTTTSSSAGFGTALGGTGRGKFQQTKIPGRKKSSGKFVLDL